MVRGFAIVEVSLARALFSARRSKEKGPNGGPFMHSSMAAISLFGGGLGSRFRPAGRLCLDARLLAAQSAQVIELGAAHLAAAHDLDRVDHRRVEREHLSLIHISEPTRL